MSYKPLSQTVTDGQKNPISSDAVYDAIDAIPDGANTALSNLAAPTAVNQDLNLDAGIKINFPSSVILSGNASGLAAGNYNILMSPEAGNALTQGSSTIAIGYRAFKAANAASNGTTGAIAIGHQAFYQLPSLETNFGSGGQSVIGIGINVGYAVTTAGYANGAVLIGHGAGSGTFMGESIFIGPSAGQNGGRSIAIGRDTARKVTSTSGLQNNVAVGHFAQYELTTGNNNVSLGNSSGDILTTGSRNIAIGQDADFGANNVNDAVAIGYQAKAGSSIVSIGKSAGSSLTSGSDNVYVGAEAGSSQTTQTWNTFIGREAGKSATGSSNIYIGRQAAVNNAGNTNVAIGVNAFRGAAGMNASECLALGWAALQAITTGSYNSGIGKDSGVSTSFGGAALTTGTYNLLIGQASGVLTAGTSGAISLGYGAAASNSNMAIGSTGQGINTIFCGVGEYGVLPQNSTSVRLSGHQGRGTDISVSGSMVVAGSAGTGTGKGSSVVLATAPAAASTGSAVNAHVHRLRVEQDGNVGIGVQNAQAKLEVAGKVKVYDGDLEISTLGKGLKIAEGADATVGVVTLAAGTATVNTAAVKSNSRIMLTNQNPGGTVGFLHVSARTADTSFVITSSNAADTSDIAWMIVNPLTVTDSDADTFITNASITDATQKRAIQRLVKSLKDESLWAKMKAIYPFVGGAEAAHKLNLKDPQDTDGAFRIVFTTSGAGAFTHDSSGVTLESYAGMNTKLNPSVSLTSAVDFHISLYIKKDGFYPDFADFMVGCTDGTNTIQGRLLRSRPYVVLNASTYTMRDNILNYQPANRPLSGLYLINSGANVKIHARTQDKDLFQPWDDGTSPASTSLPNDDLFLGNYDGIAWPQPSTTYRFATVGDSLSVLESYKLHAIIEQFQLELGRQV
jgi:hypothetical protein